MAKKRLIDFLEHDEVIQKLADESEIDKRNFTAMTRKLIKLGLKQLNKGETK